MDFRQRYTKIFGSGVYEKLLKAQREHSRDQYIRVNLSRKKVAEVEKFLKSNRVKYSKTYLSNCFKIEKSFFNLTSCIEALRGDFYVQDIASQIPVNLIDFGDLASKERKIKILDMAASPGSKTTQIADMCESLGIDCEIVALEPEVKRLTKLVNNIQKQGFENISVYNVRGEDFETKDKFDLILLDAPCSGNLVGDRDWLKKRDMNGILANSKLQKKLLEKASKLLEKDGTLIYSTCSLEPEENEENVEYAQKGLRLRSVKAEFKFPFENRPERFLKIKFMRQESIRIMPNLSKSQGFFVSVLRK